MNRLQDIDKDFIMDLFLETDSVTTVNRLVVAVANVVNENNDNINMLNQILEKEIDMGTSDEATTAPSVPPRRVKHFYERTILNYSDSEYEEKFKMKRSTVQSLINNLACTMRHLSNVVPLEKKVHMFLWLLVNDCSYSEVGALFSLHKSSVSYILQEMVSAISELQYNFISWPSPEDQHATRVKVHSRLKLPNCVGFIDACRFKIGSKNNKKREPESILLQAVCDDSLSFIDIYIGELGKTRKSKVYKDSPLSKELINFVEYENHILGDADYKLKMNLITPFSSDELVTEEEMKFNETHWKARAYIGRSFELLKERFRKLNHIDIGKLDVAVALIKSACILHNLVLLHEGVQSEGDVKEEIIFSDVGVNIDTSIVTSADEKRQFLCNYVNFIDGT